MDVEKHNSENELERWADAEFKQMPLIKAPPGLSDRIMSEIARRSALPWWKQPYYQWNILQRAVFIFASCVLLAALLWLSFTFSDSILPGTSIFPVSNIYSLAITIIKLTLSVADSVYLVIEAYKLWFIAVAACVLVLYALCVAAGTAGIAIAIKSAKERQNENYS